MQKNHFLLLKNFKNTESAQLCFQVMLIATDKSYGSLERKQDETRILWHTMTIMYIINICASCNILQRLNCYFLVDTTETNTEAGKNLDNARARR